MVTSEFQPFFMASVGASAALIGLLFVAVSVAPQRIFGPESDAVRQAHALSAFTGLANVFFISMMSLVPGVLYGLVVVVVSIPAIIQTLALLGLARQWHQTRILTRGVFLFLASAAIYGYELALGVQIWQAPGAKGALINLLFVLMGAYAVGLGRAWELLGAPRSGFVSYVWAVISALRRNPSSSPKS